MSAPVIPDALLNESFGAVLIGTVVSCALYGLTSHQFFRYYRMFPKDPMSLKQTVGILWLLDTICIALTMHVSYNYTVTHHARPPLSLDIVWSLRVIVFLTALLAFITHLFLAYRIHKLSGHNFWFSASIASTVFIRMGISIATMVLTFVSSNFPTFLGTYSRIVSLNTGSCVVSDLALSAGLIYFLRMGGKGFTSNDSFVDKALVYLVNAGLLRSALAVISFICTITMKSNLVFLAFYFIFSKLYTNSFMAILNARRNSYVPSQIGAFDLGQRTEEVRDFKGRSALAIHVKQEYHTTIDRGGASMDSGPVTATPVQRTNTFKTESEGETSYGPQSDMKM